MDLSPPIAYPIIEINAFNHMYPAGRGPMLPKTTDGHQFGLVPSQLQPKNFSSCYNQTANRNTKSHKAMLDPEPFPPSQLCCLSIRYGQGGGAKLGSSSSFKFNEPITLTPPQHVQSVTARRVRRTSMAELAFLNLKKVFSEATPKCFIQLF